ncbi:MAG: metallophosphoesterase [Patescibacteria group bacterium]|mgnify:CR=1 FL=1
MLDYAFETIFISYVIAAAGLGWILIKKYTGQKFLGVILPGLLILSALGVIESAYIEPYWLKIRSTDIQVDKLREPIKIALFSDTHLRATKNAGWLKKIASKLRAEKPDLILMAGDFLYFDDFEKFGDKLNELGALTKIAPTFAVLGNHDYGIGNRELTFLYNDQHQNIEKKLDDLGITVLRDENVKIKIKNEELWLVGFDEAWFLGNRPEKALAGLNDNLLKIGLSHHPDIAFDPRAKILDLVLSGHTHGGQIRLPWLGALGDADTPLLKKDYGRYLPDHQPKIFNTIGVGESGPHLRFFNPPEIAILKIQ